MGVRTKGRRKISVDEREYVWYVKEDFDSPYMILNISSVDKALILAIPLNTPVQYVIDKGRFFQGEEKASGSWKRYRLDLSVPEAITPAFVRECILWAVNGENAATLEWDGTNVPV